MRSALAEVKEVLGPDAVIMSNKKVTGGIEIVAAVDFSESKSAAPEPAAKRTPIMNKTNRQLSEDSVNLSASKFNFKKLMTSEISQQAKPEQAAVKNDSLASLLARQQEHKQQMSQAISNEDNAGEGNNWDTSFLKKPVTHVLRNHQNWRLRHLRSKMKCVMVWLVNHHTVVISHLSQRYQKVIINKILAR